MKMKFARVAQLARRTNKRTLSMLLAIVMIVGMAPAMQLTAHAATATYNAWNSALTNLTGTNDITISYTGSWTGTGNYIYVTSGTTTIHITGDLLIDHSGNTGGTRAPITVAKGATLTLDVSGTLTVKGQNATNGVAYATNGRATAGGNGGYAGIHVPYGATLYITGNGKVDAKGGNAGDGGSIANSGPANAGGTGGGGGAGAGIGGNGGGGGGAGGGCGGGLQDGAAGGTGAQNAGNGGAGGKGSVKNTRAGNGTAGVDAGGVGGGGGGYSNNTTGSSSGPSLGGGGGGGGGGGRCGTVYIKNSNVKATGGNGGNGGNLNTQTWVGGCGGGGYPAAGIGGGGAGAGGGGGAYDGGSGGSGFSGGAAMGPSAAGLDSSVWNLAGATNGGTCDWVVTGWLNGKSGLAHGGYGYLSNGMGGGMGAPSGDGRNNDGSQTSGTHTGCGGGSGSGGAGGIGGTIYLLAATAPTAVDGGGKTASVAIVGRSTSGYGSGAGYYGSGTTTKANGADNGTLDNWYTTIDFSTATISVTGGTQNGSSYAFGSAGSTISGVSVNTSTKTITLSANSSDMTYRVIGSNSAAANNYSLAVAANASISIRMESATIDMRTTTGRSAIALNSGSKVVAAIVGNCYVYGGPGGNGGTPSNHGSQAAASASGGAGGGAGIAVPRGATLTLQGSGKLYAYGGDAGDGGNGTTDTVNPVTNTRPTSYPTPLKDQDKAGLGGAGGGGAGAGIGGIGGTGASINGTGTPVAGGAGGGAGTITVNVPVLAVGGGGGSGGNGGKAWQSLTGGWYSHGGGGGGGGGYPAAGIGGGGGGGGTGGSDAYNASGVHSARAGGGGFSGGAGGGGYTWNSDGATGGRPGTGGTNGNGGQGGGGEARSYSGNGGGGGYLTVGGEDTGASTATGYQATGQGGAKGGGGGGGTSYESFTHGGDGGTGGDGGQLITIVDKNQVTAYNGSKITTSTSQAQGYLPANATTINVQANQGIGGGAGYTETNGKIVFMGAPGAVTAPGAQLDTSTATGDPYGRAVKVTWTKPTNTGGSGVALTSYTIVCEALGISKTLTASDVSLTSTAPVSYTIKDLPSNTEGVFTIYANNAKGASEPAYTGKVKTKGIPFAPQEVIALPVEGDGSSNSATVLWTAPDLTYNNNAIVGYTITLRPTGQSNAATPEENDLLTDEDGMTVPPNEDAVVKTFTVGASPAQTTYNGKSMYTFSTNELHFGTVYSATVQAINGAGTGDGTSDLVETASIATAPVVTVTRTSEEEPPENTNVTVSWTKPVNADGIPELISYVVRRGAVDANGTDVTAEVVKTWEFCLVTDKADEDYGKWKDADGKLLAESTNGDDVVTYSFVDDSVLPLKDIYGYTFSYTVQAKNAVGDGLPGVGKYAYEPTAPANVNRKTGTERTRELTITWPAALAQAEGKILSYNIYRKTADDEDWGKPIANVPAVDGKTVYDYRDTGADLEDEALASGVEYYYAVTAVNDAGEGKQAVSEAIATNGVPSAPVTIIMTATGPTTATVGWNAPEWINGKQADGVKDLVITSYIVSWTRRDDETGADHGSMTLPVVWYDGAHTYVPAGYERNGSLYQKAENIGGKRFVFSFNPDVELNQYSYTLHNLSRGFMYDVTVQAVTAAGAGLANTANAMTWNVPGVPQQLKAENHKDENNAQTGRLKITWAASAPNGTEVIKYTVQVFAEDQYPNGPAAWTDEVDPRISTLEALTPENILTSGGNYYVVLTPTNAVGNGPTAVVTTLNKSVPLAPTSVSAAPPTTDPDTTSLNVRWSFDEENSNGGSAITHYEVLVYKLSEGGISTLITEGAPSGMPTSLDILAPVTLSYVHDGKTVTVYYPNGLRHSREAKVEGLTKYTDYEIRVHAYNADNPNKAGVDGSALARTLREPFAVSSLKVSPTGTDGELKVDWTAPTNNGGSPITGYKVYLYKVNSVDKDSYTTICVDPEALAAEIQKGTATLYSTATVGSSSTTHTFNKAVFDSNNRPHTLINGIYYTAMVVAVNDLGEGDGTVKSNTPMIGVAAPTASRVELQNNAAVTGNDTQTAKLYWTNPTEAQIANSGKAVGYIVTLLNADGEELYSKITGLDGQALDLNGYTEQERTSIEDSLRIVGANTTELPEGLADLAITLSCNADNVAGANVTATIANLNLGTQYKLSVRMITTAPVPGGTNMSSFTTWNLPSQPANIAVAPTNFNGGLKVTWNYPTADGDSDQDPATNSGDLHTGVTAYKIFWRKAAKGDVPAEETWHEILMADRINDTFDESTGALIYGTKTNDACSVTLERLLDGDPYEFKIISLNGAGWGQDALSTVYSATPCSMPQAPVIGEALTGNRQSTIVKITPPAEWVYRDESDEVVDITDPETQRDLWSSKVLGNGGAEITSYRVYAVPAARSDENVGEVQDKNGNFWKVAGSWTFKTSVAATGKELLNVVVPNLEIGQDYLLCVRAVNEACDTSNPNAIGGWPSNCQYVRVGLPLAPTNLSVNLGRANSAVVSYTASENHGSVIKYYTAYVSKQDPDSGEWSEFAPYKKVLTNGELIETGKAIEYLSTVATVYGDEMGESMRIYMTAWNVVGESEPSEVVEVTVGAPSVPVLEPVVKAKDSVTLNWSAANGNGATMQYYKVYLRQTSGGADFDAAAAPTYVYRTTRTEVTRTIANGAADLNGQELTLQPGATYQAQVSAVNLAGESPKSLPQTFTFGVPKPPTVNELSAGVGTLTVTFTPPEDTGGENEPLTGFAVYANNTVRVLVSTGEGNNSKNVADFGDMTWGGNDNVGWDGHVERSSWKNPDGTWTVVIPDLANGSAYGVTVTAFNQYGESDQSDGVKATPATQPSAPLAVVAKVESDTEVSLTWRVPVYDGGDTVTSYEVHVFDDSGVTPVELKREVAEGESGQAWPIVGVLELSSRVTGLARATHYHFEIKAVNSRGPGAAGVSNSVKTFDLPDPPIITSWSSTANSNGRYDIEVRWAAPEYDGGTPILGYWLFGFGQPRHSTMLPATVTKFTIPNVQSGQKAPVYVQAVNAVGTANSESLDAIGGQLDAPKITGVETKIDEYSSVYSDLTVHFDTVTGTVSLYYLFDLANKEAFPGLAGYTEQAFLSMSTAELNTILRRVDPDSACVASTTLNTGVISTGWQQTGSTMYLVVAARATSGLGVPSNVVKCVVGAPDAPELVDAVAGKNSITLSWKAPEEFNTVTGYRFAGYQVYLNGVASGDLLNDSTVGLSKSEGGVYSYNMGLSDDSCGKDLTVTIVAVMQGESDTRSGMPSNAKTCKPWTLPSPVNIDRTATIIGDGTFTITFYTSNGNGLDIRKYEVLWNGSAVPSDRVTFTDNENGTITAVVTGVQNGYKPGTNNEGYPVRVTAVTKDKADVEYRNDDGTELLITTGVPPAPIITNITVNNLTDFTVTWKDSAIVTGSNIRYTLTVKPGAGSTGESLTQTLTEKTYTVTQVGGQALKANTPYLVSVVTQNNIGASQPSEVITVWMGAPQAPKDVSAVPSAGKILVSWGDTVPNGGPITKYYVTLTSESGDVISKEVDKNDRSCLIEGLDNGVKYTITVSAENSKGRGVESAPVTAIPGSAPSAPTDVRAVAISDTEVTITWEEPEFDGGQDLSYYSISGADNYTTVRADEKRSVTFDGMERGGTYTFTVTATNPVGTSDAASASTKTLTVPGAPKWEGANSSNRRINVSWYAPAETGGAPITSYTIYVRGFDNNGDLVDEPIVEKVVEPTAEMFNAKGYLTYTLDEKVLEHLSVGSEYKVSIAAKNSKVDDLGPECDPFKLMYTGELAKSKPGSPTGLVAAAGNEQITVTWHAPSYDGGGISEYVVYYGVKSADPASQTYETKSTTDTRVVITGLTNDTTYTFYVVAKNATGPSDPSFAVDASPKFMEAPGNITGLRYYSSLDGSKITFQWNPAPGKDVEYHWELRWLGDSESIGWGDTANTYYTAATRIVPNAKYVMTVYAYNSGDSSLRSSSMAITANSVLNTDVEGVMTPDCDGDTYSANFAKLGNKDANFDGEMDPLKDVIAPTAPSNLTVTGSVSVSGGIKISWTAPESWGDSSDLFATGKKYIIYSGTNIVGTVPGTELSGDQTNPATTFTYNPEDGGLHAGLVYTFQVAASNEQAGEGPKSTSLQVYVPENDAPVIDPESVVVTPQDSGGWLLSMQWTPPEVREDKKILGYRFQVNGRDDASSDAYRVAAVDGDNNPVLADPVVFPSRVIDGEKEYIVRVFAEFENSKPGGEPVKGNYSAPVEFTTILPTPDTPTIESVVAVAVSGSDEITVVWESMTDEQLKDVTGYRVYVNGVRYSVTNKANNSLTITAATVPDKINGAEVGSPITSGGTNTGKSYSVYVTAINHLGMSGDANYVVKESARSEMVSDNTMTASDYAPAPIVLTEVALNRTSRNLELSWETVALPTTAASNSDFPGVVYAIYCADITGGVNLTDDMFQCVGVTPYDPEEKSFDFLPAEITINMDIPIELGKEYVFMAKAVSVYEGSTISGAWLIYDGAEGTGKEGFFSKPSNLLFVSTKSDMVAPGAPKNPKYSYADWVVTLEWDAPETGVVSYYQIVGYDTNGDAYYVKTDRTGAEPAAGTASFRNPNEADAADKITGRSYTFPVYGRQSEYIYQIVAVAKDEDTGETFESPKSLPVSISTVKLPDAPDAPRSLRSSFYEVTTEETVTPPGGGTPFTTNVTTGYTRLYWKAPALTTEAGMSAEPSESNKYINQYTVSVGGKQVAKLSSSTPGVWDVVEYNGSAILPENTYASQFAAQEGEKEGVSLVYNGTTGEFCVVLNCKTMSLLPGTTYAVSIEAIAYDDVPFGTTYLTLSSGGQTDNFRIAYAVNVDTDGDGYPNNYLDNNHDGIVENIFATITMTGAVSGSVNVLDATFTITDGSGTEHELSHDGTGDWQVEVESDGSFTIGIKIEVSAGEGSVGTMAEGEEAETYTLKVSKLGFTSYTITDIPKDTDHDVVIKNSIVLVPGDANGDDIISALDVVFISNSIGGTYSENLDPNGDGVVTALDVVFTSNNVGAESQTVKYKSR